MDNKWITTVSVFILLLIAVGYIFVDVTEIPDGVVSKYLWRLDKPDLHYATDLVDLNQASNTKTTPRLSGSTRLIGTGNETYELDGYYHQYNVEYFPLDYNPEFDKDFPKHMTCNGFVITDGNREFINAYNELIRKKDNQTIINLNEINSERFLSAKNIFDSTKDNQTQIRVMLDELPQRDATPCDSYGVRVILSD